MANKVCIDNIWYELNKETKEATVTYPDNEEEKYQGEVVISEIVVYEDEEYDVMKIESFAFENCNDLTSITIPESVTSIEDNAFDDCSGLISIIVADKNPLYDSRNNCNAIIETKTNKLIAGCARTIIPEGVRSIGNSAFNGCSGLISITIPEGVTSIEEFSFAGCSGLTSITIPNSVTNIEKCAFYDCTALTSIILPESVTNIGENAFACCSSLISIAIPKGVTSIGKSVFAGCDALISIIVADKNLQYDSRNNCNAIIETKTNKLIAGCAKTIIPPNVTSIGEHAFNSCSSLASIIIPESVTCIGECAFFGCI